MREVSETRRRKSPRHIFRFKVRTNDGRVEVIKAYAKVRRATKPVTLTLTAADVRESIRLKGVGNTQCCSMAVCAKRQEAAFPHMVEGYIDWQYSRAYVVTKVRDGLPVECVVYAHGDSIAHLNDSKGGQLKLLQRLETGGDERIRLYPPARYTPRAKGRPEGKSTGVRSSRPAAVGAKLRFAVAQLGGV